ncbi:MAG: hypothetical protein KC680_02335 [Candidatus Peregrinibacteria bacterium]|nr:hypothetical protein [Candidatus Peregrinibacteria bacterium]
MFAITEDEAIERAIIVAFRGSGKSTIITLSYVLWAIMGREQRKFVLLVGRTQEQAKQLLKNIRVELETNPMLHRDLWPYREEVDEWRNTSLVLQKFGARITAVSVDQSVRGFRHLEHRPDLIICDDIEDLESIKSRESRDKTHNWVVSELIPAGDTRTRMIIVGNYLHSDSLTQRLREHGESDPTAIYREYPLLDEQGNCLWPGKYPNEEAVERQRQRVGDDGAWHREFLLRIISDAEQVVHPNWIHYYDQFPSERDGAKCIFTATGIDLAISKQTYADYTAMVSAKIFDIPDEGRVIYILPNPVNERLSFPETVERAMKLSLAIGEGTKTTLYIEDVQYQKALVQDLNDRHHFPAEGVPTHGQDKRSRLAIVSPLIHSCNIVFPRVGAERLIEQLVGFGKEKHDDLADAFTTLVQPLMERLKRSSGVLFLVLGDDDDDDDDFFNRDPWANRRRERGMEDSKCILDMEF